MFARDIDDDKLYKSVPLSRVFVLFFFFEDKSKRNSSSDVNEESTRKFVNSLKLVVDLGQKLLFFISSLFFFYFLIFTFLIADFILYFIWFFPPSSSLTEGEKIAMRLTHELMSTYEFSVFIPFLKSGENKFETFFTFALFIFLSKVFLKESIFVMLNCSALEENIARVLYLYFLYNTNLFELFSPFILFSKVWN